jgi:erythromycin esterase-like protein
MSSRIVHFGVDACHRVEVLAEHGFSVATCGASVPRMRELLRSNRCDAVALEGDSCDGNAINAARAMTSAPLVLFQQQTEDVSAPVDLVVEPLVAPADWLPKLEELIARCNATRADAERMRAQAAATRSEAQEVREQARATRKAVRATITKIKQSGGRPR